MQIEAVQADITTLEVDVVVNAANSWLLGGGGVDGAIHRAAGPGLLAECKTLGGCPSGEAKITGGYDLPAQWVVHAVGPVWRGGDQDEAALLASCYRRAIELAAEVGATSVAFPAISTGAYGYPQESAAEIAVTTLRACAKVRALSKVKRVVLVANDPGTLAIYQRLLAPSPRKPRKPATPRPT